MANNDKVAVILPTYNRSHTIQRAMKSVFQQTFTHWELWVIDDGSTDNTERAVREIQTQFSDPQKIHYIYQKNKGVSAARNRGIKASHSDWIALLDSDDEWLPQRLEKQIQWGKCHTKHPLIHSNESWLRNGIPLAQKKKHKKQGGRIFSQCVPLCCISPSASLIQRSLFNEIGLFNETFPVCEDYELWLRITCRYDVGFVDDVLIIKHGGHKDQLSRKYFAMDYWRVKALSQYIDSELITKQERQLVASVIKEKCNVLLNGYDKHRNFSNKDEVNQILNSLSYY